MALGRGFTSKDDRAVTNSPITVISDSFWTRRFARDPQVIGKTLLVGGHAVTIVGVTAPGFEGCARASDRHHTAAVDANSRRA